MRSAVLGGLCAAAAFLTACGSGGSANPSGPSSPSPTAKPKPTSTVLSAGAQCRQPLGGTVAFADPKHGVALRVTTTRPRVSSHALASYAHGPANGHYLVINVAMKNISANGYRLDPTAFVFTTSSGRRLTVDSGNSPYSGASHVLDPTYLVSGASEHGPLIYDSGQLHGHIALIVAGKPACTWTV
jgi:hypothetical protein